MDPAASPCGKYFGGGPGYKLCNGKQFDTFYAGAQADCRMGVWCCLVAQLVVHELHAACARAPLA
jgi:hypothetical protein